MLNAILAVLLWSTQATAFKLTLRFTNQFGLILISGLTSFVIYLLAIVFSKKTFNLKENWRSLYLGFLNPFLYYLILFSAYKILKAQEALILNYLWPIVLTVIASIFLKRPLKITKIIALLVSFLGAFITITQGKISNLSFANPMGVTLALLSTVIWATYWILNMTDKREPVTKLFFNFLFGNVFLVIFLLINRPIEIASPIAFLGGIYVGLFEMGVTFLLWLRALQTIKDTARVNNLIYISPFLSLIFIALVLKEPIRPASIVGLILIISGVLLQELTKERKEDL